MSKARPKIAVFAGGSGTTFESFVHASQAGIVDVDVDKVISNNGPKKAEIWKVIDRMNRMYNLNILGVHISNLTHQDGKGEDHEITLGASSAMAEVLEEGNYPFSLALGFMKKMRGDVLGFGIANEHPGLLPATQGCDMDRAQQRVLDEGHEFTGHTLHWMDATYDTGPEIQHRDIPVMPWDNHDRLVRAVQMSERLWVPQFVQTELVAA